MEKNVFIAILAILVVSSANALFFDGPKSKCGPVSNAACN